MEQTRQNNTAKVILTALLSVIMTLAMTFALLSATTQTAHAMPAPTVEWEVDTTVQDTTVIDGYVSVTNDITLTINKNVTLTVNGFIYAPDHTLTVAGEGELFVNATNGANGEDACAPLEIYNGTAGFPGSVGFEGNICVAGASVVVKGGNGGNGGYSENVGAAGGNGGNAIEGNVTFESGSITAVGGKGGNGGYIYTSGGYATNGSDGKAVTGTITGATVQESDDNSNWTDISSGTTSTKRYVKIELPNGLWIGGTEVTEEVTSGEGWSFDAETNTLTLNNYEYNSSTEGGFLYGTKRAGLYYKGEEPLNVVLVSKYNYITLNDDSTVGIFAEGGIRISGSGNLSIYGKEGGIDADVTMSGGELRVNCSNDGSNGSTAITKLTMLGGNVEADGGSIYVDGDGGYAIDTLVMHGGYVQARGGYGYDLSAGFWGKYIGHAAVRSLTMDGGVLMARGSYSSDGDAIAVDADTDALNLADTVRVYGGDSNDDFPDIKVEPVAGEYERYFCMFFEGESREVQATVNRHGWADEKVTTEEVTFTCQTMNKAFTEWSGDYYVDYDLTIGSDQNPVEIQLTGDVNLVLKDEVGLIIYGTIKSGEYSLNVYGNDSPEPDDRGRGISWGRGTLMMTNPKTDPYCALLDVDAITVHGGGLDMRMFIDNSFDGETYDVKANAVTIYAGNVYIDACNAYNTTSLVCNDVKVYGGELRARAGDGDTDGKDGIIGSVSLYGGHLYADGGYANNGVGGSGINGDLYVYGGNAEISGGDANEGQGGSGVNGDVYVYDGEIYINAGCFYDSDNNEYVYGKAIAGKVTLGEAVGYSHRAEDSDEYSLYMDDPVTAADPSDMAQARLKAAAQYFVWNSETKKYDAVYEYEASSESYVLKWLWGGWIFANADFTQEDEWYVDGDVVNLILADGVTLTALKGLQVPEGKTLNIYAQSDNAATMGKLIINGGVYGQDGASGTVNIYGGIVVVSGTEDAVAISTVMTVGDNVVVYGGENADPDTVIEKTNGDYVRTRYMTFKAQPAHTHDYSTKWSSDGDTHWHACLGDGDCDAPKADEAAHIYGEDITKTAYYTCSVCKQVDTDRKAAYTKLKTDNDAANAVEALIDTIGTVEYTEDSKNKIDAARAAYDALTGDQKELVTNYATLTAAEATYATLKADNEAAEAVIAKINAIGEVKYTEDSKNKIDEAKAAYETLTGDQKELVTNYETLTTAETTYDTLKADNEAANAVEALIDAIGEVKYTEDSKNKIEAARTAYDALTPAQQVLVGNYATLTAAETTYAKLKADNEAAEAVIAKINAIGDVAYTTESKGKIDEAKAAYEALTGDQKGLVTNYETLTTAETTYDTLKADNEAANAVEALIDAIGTVEYTEVSKAKIDKARAAYDALTGDQKELVTNYETLTAAEQIYAEKEIEANKGLSGGAIAGIVIGVVFGVGLLTCCGFAIVWFVIKKKTWADFVALIKKK